MEIKAKKYWMGLIPTYCQVCNGPLGEEFVDGRLKTGQWAFMDTACHKAHGVGLGTGRGQRYITATGEKLEG